MKKQTRSRLPIAACSVLLSAALLASCAGESGDVSRSSAQSGGSYTTAEAAVAPETAAYYDDYGSGYLTDADYDVYELAVDGADYNIATGGGQSGGGSVQLEPTAATGRKIITTVDLQMESTDYDNCVNGVYDAIQQAGGYVEYSDIYGGTGTDSGTSYDYERYGGRYLYLRIRVPETDLPGFIQQLQGLGNLLSKQESAEDITLQYVDVESRVKALETEQEQLIALLEVCETVEEMILLQDRLSYVRYQIESYQSQLRVMQNQVSYSTINLHLSEVVVYTERDAFNPTISERIATGFGRTINNIKDYWVNLLVWLAVNSIYLVLLAVVAVVLVVTGRRRLKKRAARPQAARLDEKPGTLGDDGENEKKNQ